MSLPRSNVTRVLACALLAAPQLAACKSSVNTEGRLGLSRAEALGAESKGSGSERCDSRKTGRETSEYDTSGDGVPDVRKVYLSTGAGVDARLVMICRETDANGDGKKDVIRYYDDEGRSLREESDRNFDGRMDIALVFQDGNVVRKELDENRDGKIDTKIFLENGKPLRSERDLKGRSSAQQWVPDRWEYYEEGRMVRMGTDLDGDSRVDRWDRDHEYKSAKDREEEKQMAEEQASEDEGNSVTTAAPASENAGAGGAGAGGAGGAGGKGGAATAKKKK